jgi:hypothetical protein
VLREGSFRSGQVRSHDGSNLWVIRGADHDLHEKAHLVRLGCGLPQTLDAGIDELVDGPGGLGEVTERPGELGAGDAGHLRP